jgi:multidrug resistance efflux pump
MKLRRRKARITALPDSTPPPKRSRRAALWIYLLLLGLIAAYLALYFLDRTVHFAVRGQVERDIFPVETDVEGRLTRFLVTAGERVHQGQPLAVVTTRHFSAPPPSLSSTAKLAQELARVTAEAQQVGKERQRLERAARMPENREALVRLDPKVGAELIKSRRDMALQGAILKRLRTERTDLQSQLAEMDTRYREERALELRRYDPQEARALKARLDDVIRQADSAKIQLEALRLHRDARIQSEIESMRAQEALLARERQALSSRLADLKNPAGSPLSGPLSGQISGAGATIRAPLDGRVALFYTEEGRFCRQGASLLALAREHGQMHINGYFPLEAQPQVKPGAQVRIKFPDGYRTTGIVARAYATALPEPIKVTHNYVPVEVALKVEIHPTTDADAQRWAAYDQMDVRLEVRRWP